MSFQGSYLFSLTRVCNKVFRKPYIYYEYHRLASTFDSSKLLQNNPLLFTTSTAITKLKPIIAITPGCFGSFKVSYCNNVTDKEKTVTEKKDQVENIVTIPNILTVSRIFMCPVIGYLVINSDFSNALWLFLIAGITDLLDGWIARTFPSQSSLAGSFLDPMADKLLIGTLFISLTFSGLIPVPLTALIIVRDALLIGAGFYVRYISLAPPRTLSRYFDASLVSAQLAPTNISKFNTGVQLLLVASSLAVPAFSFSDSLLQILWYVTGTTTVLSGLSYVFAKNTYRIISRPRTK